MTEFLQTKLGITNVYFLKTADGYILIDTGTRFRHKQLIRFLSKNSINTQDIKLIIITHGHVDHAGGVKRLKEYTDAKVLVHREDAEALKFGKNAKVRSVIKLFNPFLVFTPRFIDRFDPVEPDIVIEGEYSLTEFGINARVLHTPGHTLGSISVLDDEGNGFVGDTAKGSPYKIFPGLPTVVRDLELLLESWRLLIKEGAKRIYMAHGKSIPIEILEKRLKRLRYW